MHYTGSGTPACAVRSTPQASSRRSTLNPGGHFAGRSIKGLTPNRSAMFLHPGFVISPLISGRLSASSVSISSGSHKFPTTYSAPPLPPPPHTPGVPRSSAGTVKTSHSTPKRHLRHQHTPQSCLNSPYPPPHVPWAHRVTDTSKRRPKRRD